MFYTIYKTTNNINGKIYIGKHKTRDLDDNYLGSGKILNYAIKKHGINNFTREYLFIFDNEEDMNNKELELVSEEFIKEDTNYNMNIGGYGGWEYVNKNSTPEIKARGGIATKKAFKDNPLFEEDIKSKISKKMIGNTNYKNSNIIRKNKYPNGTFYNKVHSDETKLKMSKSNTHMKGSNNSQYGMMWIYSLEEKISKRINKNEIIPEGWFKGRKMSF